MLWQPSRRMRAAARDAMSSPDTLASAPPPVHSTARRRFADSAYLVLVVSCWFASNLLAVLGCAVVAFAVLGGGDWDATFMHIDNLASRYVEADVGRRLAFQHSLVQSFSLLLIAFTIFRAPGFIRRVRRELAEGPRP